MAITRCINLDWVEFYCLESVEEFPCDADYFRRHGYCVYERDYGTRQYEQMFTVLDDHDLGFVEIRRKPVSGMLADRVRGIFSPYSCHIKLCNRYCYADNAMTLFCDFLAKHGYRFQRIFRLDLCLDFEKFDSGDDPNDFLRRYMKGKFTKINQAHVGAHGDDTWSERKWHSLAWGSQKSMVSTKFYNKTIELKQVKDKPYIRYAWFKAGLVEDYMALTKTGSNGKQYTPDIWRVEFSIKSAARGWYRVEDCNGKHTKTLAMEHYPATYSSKEDQLKAFEQLCRHYFHFKYYEEGVRKDRCKDKVLFKFDNTNETYVLDRLLTDKPSDKSAQALLKRLKTYRNTTIDQRSRQACDVLIASLERDLIRGSMSNPYDATELTILQQLVSYHTRHPEVSVDNAREFIEELTKLEQHLF